MEVFLTSACRYQQVTQPERTSPVLQRQRQMGLGPSELDFILKSPDNPQCREVRGETLLCRIAGSEDLMHQNDLGSLLQRQIPEHSPQRL